MKSKREQVESELSEMRFRGQEMEVTIDNVMKIFETKTKKKTVDKIAQDLVEGFEKKVEFLRWTKYRKSLGKTIKVEETAFRLAHKFNDTDIETIKDVVNHSIDNQYQGLFWDKFKNNGTITAKKSRNATEDDINNYINS